MAIPYVSYNDKLSDYRWIDRRWEILERDNYECQRCLNSFGEEILNVHHLRYFKGHEPWDYADEDLVTLCQPCHGAVTRFTIPEEEIHNKWITYERMKKEIAVGLPANGYEKAISDITRNICI